MEWNKAYPSRYSEKGLYLVGSDAGARGIGTEIASGSALGLYELLETGK